MAHLRIAYELGRFLAIATWCRFHQAIESRITRCSARCEARRFKGPITQGMRVLCSVADLLWSALPCGKRIPVLNVNRVDRPCGCEEEK